MKKIVMLALFLVACSSASASASHIPKIKKGCTLSVNGVLTPTNLSSDCKWSLHDNNSLRIKTIDDVDIAILLGKPLSKGQQKEWNVQKYLDCSFESVGVKITKNKKIIAVSQPISDLLVCPDMHIDKKVFYSYSW